MIYFGNFLYVNNQQEVAESDRRHGEFNLVVEAPSNQAAIALFKERIIKLRETSDFFEGDCAIYFNQLLEFHNFPKDEALMLNYRSIVGDPLMPFIGCSIPNSEADNCRIFDWKNNKPEVDGEDESIFLTFSTS